MISTTIQQSDQEKEQNHKRGAGAELKLIAGLAQQYQKEFGLSKASRLIPSDFSSISGKLDDLFEFDGKTLETKIDKKLITPWLDEVAAESENGRQAWWEQKKELPVIERQQLIETVKEACQKWYKKRFGEFGQADFLKFGARNAVEKAIFGIGQVEDHHITYANYGQIDRLYKISGEISPFTYIYGDPGVGKNNTLHLLIELALKSNYWVYSNIPIKGNARDHVYQVQFFSDLFARTNGVPSVIDQMIWEDSNGIKAGSLLALDEKGMDDEANALTRLAKAANQGGQRRRHLELGYAYAGVQRFQKKQEATWITGLVEAIRIEMKGRTNSDRSAVYRYEWEVDFKGNRQAGIEPDRVRGIPKSKLVAKYKNRTEMVRGFVVDFYLEAMLDDVRPDDCTLEELGDRCAAWVRENCPAQKNAPEVKAENMEKLTRKMLEAKRLLDSGMTQKEAAEELGVTRQTIINWKKQWKEALD